MATIDYKEKYEQAMERARQFREKPYLEDSAGIVNYIFPELAESEDERIRQFLIHEIEEASDSFMSYYNMSKKDVLAWLEKQDYTFEIKEGHWYKCVCDYMLNGSYLMFKNDRLYYCRSDWRLRGEIDERNVKDIGVNGYKSFFRPATNQEIKDWLEKQCEQNLANSAKTCKIEQKPAWSEDELKVLNEIIEDYEKANKSFSGYQARIDWLKSLKDRIIPQPKQEWSEEDDSILKEVLYYIEYINRTNVTFQRTNLTHLINWLKSLKNRYAWKPSGEQMEAVKYSIYCPNKQMSKVLFELYQDLKKLREE